MAPLECTSMLTNERQASDTSSNVESIEFAKDNHNVLKPVTKRVVPLQDATGVAVPGCLQPQPYFLAGNLQWVETNPSNIRFFPTDICFYLALRYYANSLRMSVYRC